MTHRINILGASGCGASTLGRALARRLAIPYFDGDDYYHEPSEPPFQKPRDPEERCALLTRDLASAGSWVLAGGVAGWTPPPQLDFTTIVFLTAPAEVRLERLRRREHQRFGDRILPGGDMHETHREFLTWASRYDAGDVEGKTRARHEAYLAEQSCPVVRLDGTLRTATLVERVLERSGSSPAT